MNFKRKNKTNRSLRKKTDGADYGTPKVIQTLIKDRKTNKEIKEAL